MNDSARKKRTELLLRTLLPAAALLAFCTRFLSFTFPGPDDFRAFLNTTLLDHIASIVQVVLLLLSAAGLGAFVLRKLRAAGGALCATGLGLGATALAVFLLGSIGITGPAYLALLIVPPVLFARDIRSTLENISGRIRAFLAERPPALCIIALVVAVVLLLNILRAFVPPLDYDVLEYHFGAPAQHLKDGGIHFLPRNVYAAMPSNVEMLYLLGLGLKGELIRGAVAAKLINVALGVLAALAAGRLARKLSGSPLAGKLAAAGFYVLPWTSFLSNRAYVELGMIFFALLALCAFFDYLSLGERRSVILAGVFAGLSAGCKYPAVLFLVLPMAAALFVAHAMQKEWRAAFARAAVFGAVALVVLSPWLIRNAAATGNPTYPLLYGLFDGANWSPEQDAKWASAHSPGPFGFSSFVGSMRNFANRPKDMGAWYLWLPVLAGVVITVITLRKSKWPWLMAGYAALCLVMWYLFTHRIARFLAPWAMIAVVPAACAAARAVAVRRVAAYALIIATIALWAWPSLKNREREIEAAFALGTFNEHTALGQLTEKTTFSYGAIRAINALPPGSRVLMIGEARTFYCTTDVVAATVFDTNPLAEMCNRAGDADEVRNALAAGGVTHIYVSLPETKRLRQTYAFEYEGRRLPGYWNLTESGWRVLADLITNGTEPPVEFGRPVPLPWLENESDRRLFPAFSGGRVIMHKNVRCLPFAYALYKLK